MARFTVCEVTLIFVLAAAASASAHCADVTSATRVEIVNSGESPCRQEIEKHPLSSCRQYLRDSSRFEPMPGNEGGGWREEFPRCCEVLERINKRCRCEAVKQVAQQQRQAGELQGREIREMLQTAQRLPNLCRISPQYCDIYVISE